MTKLTAMTADGPAGLEPCQVVPAESLLSAAPAEQGAVVFDQDGKTWTAWLTSHAGDIQPARHLYLAHAGLTLEAAAQGQGVAMGDNLT
ncbi:MAG: hypothetical protein ACK40A_08580, partial [Pannonibacter indicus]